MNKRNLLFILLLTMGTLSRGQATRYFEFKVSCGHGNWQDTTFIAAATNPVLIDTVLVNLARPINQRKFISGPIAGGNDGYNHNAGHWFLWHFIIDQWDLTESAIELCDGCPYTDVDADTTTWIQTIGQYCPWSGVPVREVLNPVGLDESPGNDLLIFPNPAKDDIYIKWNNTQPVSVTISDPMGKVLSIHSLTNQNNNIHIEDLPGGIYFFKITDGNKAGVKKIIVERK
jgi:hypothetical protein